VREREERERKTHIGTFSSSHGDSSPPLAAVPTPPSASLVGFAVRLHLSFPITLQSLFQHNYRIPENWLA